MTGSDPEEEAREAKHAGEPVRAGDAYTIWAYTNLSNRDLWEHPHDVFWAQRAFADAVICYRLGGRHNRALNRSKQGTLIGTDVAEQLPETFDPPLLYLVQGTLAEYNGDLRLLAGREHVGRAYDRARARYTEAAEASESGTRFPLGDCEEQNDYSVLLFNELVDVTGSSVEPVFRWDSGLTLSEWVDYKEEHLPGLVERLLDIGIEAYAED